jgi:TATA-binding protein-associated factor Taf7
MADVIEITVLEDGTSEVVERDFTAEELEQREADQAAAEAAETERVAAQEKAAADRAALLKKLGITADEAALLLAGV